jgi:excisionase family DNA binding protein
MDQQQDFVTIKEFAELMRVKVGTVHDWILRKKISSYKNPRF